jgi:hypothetical protein
VLARSEPFLAEVKCGAGGIYLESTGILMSVTVDKNSTIAGTDKMSESKGKQSPNHLEGEAPRQFEEFYWEVGEREEAGMAASLVQKDEAAAEVNAVF